MALSKTNEEDEFRIPRMYYEEEKAKKVAAALPDKMQKHFRDKLKQKAKIENYIEKLNKQSNVVYDIEFASFIENNKINLIDGTIFYIEYL